MDLIHLLANIHRVKRIQTISDLGTHFTMVLQASLDLKCSAWSTQALMYAVITQLVMLLMKNYASDGINSPLSSLLLDTLKKIRVQELSHGISRHTVNK